MDTPTVEQPKKRRGGITRATSAAMKARRLELAAQGKIKIGRPKGSLNKETIAKINSRQTFVEEVSKQAGILANDLLRQSKKGDTRATLGALDRIGIAPVQQIKHEITHRFSLIDLSGERALIDGNPDMRIIGAEDVPQIGEVEPDDA